MLHGPPGAEPYPKALAERLWTAYEARGRDYEPRTEHLHEDGQPVYVNRLILEDSPYLIQHAHNPVDWYPWGAEAFEKAQREDKPIFLSIGYSTCHWCHVMERESFDNEDVARRLNEGFVSIKVDREQRPDVDQVYMTAVHVLGQRGGWPMSSFLTPDGHSFFGGTYYPRESFVQLLDAVANAWDVDRQRVLTQAHRISDVVRDVMTAAQEAAQVDEEVLRAAVDEILSRFDPYKGGFSPAPKFPHEPELLFLLGRAARSGDERVLNAVSATLDHMARGGIYDQVGGGFHRYSTDADWLVPHFEKMLYNQAHLARAYLEASRLVGDPFFERVARQTLDYVLRDMTSPQGGFYSATDADSEGREGEFFVWTVGEIRSTLSSEEADLALRLFGATSSGNFEGKNILHLPAPLKQQAEELGLSLQGLLVRLDRIRHRLYNAREERPRPLRDDKIVTAWNAMMITTLARASTSLREDRYAEAAVGAAEFLWRHSRRQDGRLWRAVLQGTGSVSATQNDHAYMLEAFAALYDATGDERWLDRAGELADSMVEGFWDDDDGGFFLGEDDYEGRLPARPKSSTDGAIPSGNAVAARAFAQLAERTGDAVFRQRAEATLAAFSGRVRGQPSAFSYLLLAADELLHGAAGPLAHGARGAVKAEASVSAGGRLQVRVELAEGWHLNSDQPLQQNLMPTRMDVSDGWQLANVNYPDAETVTLGFQEEPLAVFQGSFTIHGVVKRVEETGPVVPVRLSVQACDERKCLRPEELTLEIPWPKAGH
ncbi:MAG: DUF255 domain-containing protein [Thermoanaerobaculia bacterium]|nr:DUF255 domain-containing protein [Thermoanaerobaculia bacterium]